jgi:putative Holliday junction resolvase
MRVISIDYGSQRIGMAISDPLNIIPISLPTLIVNDSNEIAIEKIKNVYNKYSIGKIIIGYPIGLSGNKTSQTEKVDVFIELLKTNFDCQIIKWDERYTSVEAKEILIKKGINVINNKEKVDQMAAFIIMKDYLNSNSL